MNPIREILENGYFHSLHYLINRKLHWTERLFWLICIPISVCGAVQIISIFIVAYKNQKAAIKIDTNYLGFKTAVPAIFFCEKREMKQKILDEGLERFGEEFSFDGDAASDNVEYLRSVIFYIPFETSVSYSYCYKPLTTNSLSPNKKKCRIVSNLTKDYGNWSKKVRSNCSEIFNTCYIENKKYDCCGIFHPTDTYMGTCYAFNSYYSDRFENGTEKKVGLDFYIPKGAGKKMFSNLSVEVKHSDLSVWYLSNSALPTKMEQKDSHFDTGLDSLRGRYLDIVLRLEPTVAEVNLQDMSSKNRGCRYFNESNLEEFGEYSLTVCEIQCIKNAQYLYCNCVVHVLPSNLTKSAPECDFYGIYCVNKLKEPQIAHYVNNNCTCDFNCEVQVVNKVGLLPDPRGISHMPFRSPSTVKCLNFLTNAPYLRYVRYSTKQDLDFIVAIGGIFGLFWGCSFLSFTQFLYYFIAKPITDFIRKRKMKEEERTNIKLRKKFIENRSKMEKTHSGKIWKIQKLIDTQ